MERLSRLSALVALFTLLVAGCGKDAVSNPGSGTGLAAQDSLKEGSPGVTAQGSPEQGHPAGSSGLAGIPAAQQRSETAAGAPSNSGAANSSEPEPPTARPGEILLRLNLKKGQRFTYELTRSVDLMGHKVVTTITFVTNVADATGDKYVMEYKFEDVKVSTSDPRTKNMLEQQMSGVKNTSFTIDVDKLGRMSNPRGEGAAAYQEMGGQSAFGIMLYPEEPVKVGDTWAQTVPIPGLDGNPLKINHKLTAISGDVATFNTSGSHSMQMPQPGGQQGGGSMSMKTDFSTTTKVDIDTGMLIEMNGTWTITFGGAGAQAGTQQVTMRLRRK